MSVIDEGPQSMPHIDRAYGVCCCHTGPDNGHTITLPARLTATISGWQHEKGLIYHVFLITKPTAHLHKAIYLYMHQIIPAFIIHTHTSQCFLVRYYQIEIVQLKWYSTLPS